MASNTDIGLAVARRKKEERDKARGKQYDGTAKEESRKNDITAKSSSTKSGGAKTDKSTGKTGDWLKNKAAESSVVNATEHNAAKQPSAFERESKNAYTSYKSKVYKGTTDKKYNESRIREIKSEISELQKARSGIERARSYGNIDDLIAENERRESELWKELNELEKQKPEIAKTTFISDLPDDERESRVKEINSELSNLSRASSGLSRASRYSNVDNLVAENEARRAALTKELQELGQVGSFTASELKQSEADAAKRHEWDAQRRINSFGPRPRVEDAEEVRSAYSELYDARNEVKTVKREKALYDDITEFSNVVNEDNFGGQWRANYRSNELSREADKAMDEYLSNPTEKNKEIAYAYDALAREYAKNNEKALDDENVKASWLTKSVAGYLPQFKDQILPELVGGGIGLAAGSLVGAPNVGMSIGAGIGTFSQSYGVIRGSVFRILLSEGVDEETALNAANDEALINSIIESGETALSWLAAGGGKALSAIGNAAKASVAKGSTNAATKVVANLASKATNRAATKAAASVASPAWKTGVKTAAGIVGNSLTEYGEEFLQQGVSIANKERALSGSDESLVSKTGKLLKGVAGGTNHEARTEMHEAGTEGFKIGLLFGGSQTIVNNVVSHYANAKTVEAKNEYADSVVKDEKALDALIKSGKESGEGTVSAKIANEIETARKNGKEASRKKVKQLIEANEIYKAADEKNAQAEPETLLQAAREAVARRNRTDGVSLLEARRRGEVNDEVLDRLTGYDVEITADEVRKVTGFGEEGAKLVANLSNQEGATFSKAMAEVKASYVTGFQQPDLDIKKAENAFVSKAQADAFTAGQMDRQMQDLAAKERFRNAVVNMESGFLAENLPSDVTETQVGILNQMAEGLGVKSYVAKGLKGNAEYNRQTGEVPIDFDFEREIGADGNRQKVSIVFHAAHEMALHRVVDLAPEEGSAFVYAMYNHLAGNEPSNFTLADEKRNAYAAQDVEISLAEAMEELSANNILYLYNNDEARFHDAIDRIVNGTDEKAKQGLRKYVDFLKNIIKKISDFLTGKSGRERAEGQAELDEITKLRDMFETAFAKAVENKKAIQARSTESKTSKNLEIKAKEDYNYNVSHSLKWRTDLNARQYRMVENWIRQVDNHEPYRIADTDGCWYKGRIDGEALFAIYSTATPGNPTILYERKGDGGSFELDILMGLLEEIENGKSVNGKSAYVNWVSRGGWMRIVNSSQNNTGNLGGGGHNQNAGVLPGQSQRNGSPAFWNVIENLRRTEQKSYSLKDNKGNTLTEAQSEYFKDSKVNSAPDVSFSLKNTNNGMSAKDRKDLLDIIEHLKGEFEVTKFPKADPKKLAKMTRDILKEYSSHADYDETFASIDSLYRYMANGEDGHPAVWDDVYSRAYKVALEIVKNALVKDDYLYQENKALRDYLRTTRIKFYEGFDSIPSVYENFNEFRKRNMGRLNFTNDGRSIDSVYQELSSLYPEFFNEEEQTNSADQLERIVEVLDSIRTTEANPFDGQIERVSMHLANDLTSRFFDIPQAKPTFADKAERRVVEAKIKGEKKAESIRQQKDERIKKLIELQKEKTKKKIDKLRQQRDDKVRKEQEKRRAAISKMSESQKAKVIRARIMRHARDLSKKLVNPTDNQHIPHELRGAVAALLESINLESNYTYDTESGSYKKNDDGLPAKRTQVFNELRDIYKNIAFSVVVDPDLIVEGGLLSNVISLADKRIVDMTSSELETVWQTIRAVEASISTANKTFAQGKFATISAFAEALRADNAEKKERTELKGVLGKGKTTLTLNMLTPETYFHFLGNAGDSIFRMMRDAQDKHISIMKEVAEFTHDTLKDVNVNVLENTMHTVKLGGENVQLTTAQLMELYVLMKRGQAVEHIMVGGILPDVTDGKGLKKNTRVEPIRNISADEISTALSKLTDKEKKIADELQKFVSTVLSAYGNEASIKVYNYEKFLEKNYWTIRTNKQEISSEIGKDTSVTSVANKGMAKGTLPHANTSVRIGSIFDTFASHSSDMATYAAWLGASEDINRIRNFVFWEEGARTGTVKGILDTVHGAKVGSEYLEKLLTDIAIGVKGTDNMNPFDKFIGGYKAASVGANLRVIIQQPTAILRALDMIDARYLAQGAVRPLKGFAKAKKYAPIAQWKDWGYFDINTGRQMKDVLFDNASKLEKAKQVGMWGASMADSLAWGQLWNAVEAETKATHKELEVGSEAYYETVAKRFTEIVDHTQVVDGILQRSQLMRSPDALTKMATSFMGEPTKQYNMAVSALYDAMNGKGDARKRAVSQLGRTAVSLAVAGIINACAQSIIDAMRDDDTEKDYWEKWTAAFVGDGEETNLMNSNLGDTVNPLNYVPFAKDAMSIFAGYDVKRMDTEAIAKTYNAIVNMYKAVTGTGKYTITEASAQLFAEIARFYGLPVANVKRDIKSLIMSVATITDSPLMQYRMEKGMLDINYAGNSKNFIDILFNAYKNDKAAYRLIYKDLVKNGYSEDDLEGGIEARMNKADASKKKYKSSLSKVKQNRLWKTATAVQRKNAEADLNNFLTSTSEAMGKIRVEAMKFGIDETEYTLWQLAKEMVSDGKDGTSVKEKAAAMKLLNLTSDAEWGLFLLNNESKGANYAYENGIDSSIYADFVEALAKVDKPTKKGKYGTYTQDEAREAVELLEGLSYEEKAALWQSVNTTWKKNPYR